MKKIIGPVAVVLGLAAVIALGFMGYNLIKGMVAENVGDLERAKVVGEAPTDTFKGFEGFTEGDKSFEVGVNKYGQVIFVNRTAATDAVKAKCAQAIQEMRKQDSALGRFRSGNMYEYYMAMGNPDLIVWDNVSEQVLQQSDFFSKFLDIYMVGDPKGNS